MDDRVATDPADGIEIGLDYAVPFLWRDERTGRERFAVETLRLPVRIRGVDPAHVNVAWLEASPVSQVEAHLIHGARYVCYRGCPITALAADDGKPRVLGFATAHLPMGLSPTPAETRRGAQRMRANAIEHPGAMAAARIARIAERDLLQDGRFVYERNRLADDEVFRRRERAFTWLRQCSCDVAMAGERTLRAEPGDRALAEQLGLLRRAMLPTLFHGLPEADRPALESLVRQTALMLAESHPTDRQRAAMSRIADSFPDLPVADEEAFAGLAP